MSPVSEQNDFPQPANARPPAPPADQPSGYPASQPNLANTVRSLMGQESFVLDPDVRLACEDLCQASEGRNWKAAWPQWLNQMVNESIRGYLGR